MELHFSRERRGTLGRDAYRQLRDAIVEGRLGRGQRLPATRELAERLGVSRNTVLRAYERLTAEGLLEGRAGAGTFVAGALAESGAWRARVGAIRPRAFFRRVTLAETSPPPRWDFQVGVPDVALFPWDEWRRLVASRERHRAAGPAYPQAQGDPRARAAVARHVAVARSVRAGADDLVLTSGAQQAFDLVARVLIEPGDCVAMEDPGYPKAARVFASYGARVTPVRVDREGLLVDALPREAKLVYVTPSHQFPLGVPMSLARRLALLRWSEQTGAAIVEDDYDSEFRFEGPPIAPLQSLDRRGRVLYVGTFSKVLRPSLRIGFVVAPASLVPAIVEAKTLADAHGAPEAQQALADWIEEGAHARHVRRLVRIYRERHARLVEAIARRFGARVEQLTTGIGLHHTVLFRDARIDTDAIAARASERGLSVQSLRAYALGRDVAGIALGYGAIEASEIAEGVKALASAVRSAHSSG